MTVFKSCVFTVSSSDPNGLAAAMKRIDNECYAIVAVTHVAEEGKFYIFCQKPDTSAIVYGDSVYRVSKSY